LVDFADKLGFMSQTPSDADFYLGFVNAHAHAEAFKQSLFFKELSASLEKVGKPDASAGPLISLIENHLGDNAFICGARGSSAFLASLMELDRLNGELTMRRLGETKGVPSGAAGPFSFLEPFLQVPELRQRVEKWLLALEAPPILVGLQMDDPEAGARAIFTPDFLADVLSASFEQSTIKTKDGIEFQVMSTDGSKLLTQERTQNLLQSLPETVGQEAKDSLTRALEQARTKHLCFGWGIRGKYLLVAAGKNLDHVRFAGSPKESLVSLPEMAVVLPFKDKNLMLLSYESQQLLKETTNPHPLLPMLKSVLDGLKAGADDPAKMSAALKVEGLLPGYGKLEEAVFDRKLKPRVGVVWWEQGLKAEVFGGVETAGYAKGKPLRFAPLIDDSRTLLGIAYQHDRDYDAKQTAWVEALFQILYGGAGEFLRNGGAGIFVQSQFSVLETSILPHLLNIYGAQKELSLKGLGTDAAFLMDAEGKIPALPGAPPESKGKPLLRFTTFSEVANRSEVASSWEKTSAAITAATKQFTAMAAPGGNSGNAAFALPDPISSDKNGVTSYFFGLPFFSGDLLPCASLNDSLLMLSTSKTAAEAYAAELAKLTTPTSDGFVLSTNPSALIRYIIQTGELFVSDPKPAQKEAFQEAIKWTKPFHRLRTRFFEESGLPRCSFSWVINDLDQTE
jgi:hypothetical protein